MNCAAWILVYHFTLTHSYEDRKKCRHMSRPQSPLKPNRSRGERVVMVTPDREKIEDVDHGDDLNHRPGSSRRAAATHHATVVVVAEVKTTTQDNQTRNKSKDDHPKGRRRRRK